MDPDPVEEPEVVDVEPEVVWTGDVKDHIGYGQIAVWTGDVKDHIGYGQVAVWAGDVKELVDKRSIGLEAVLTRLSPANRLSEALLTEPRNLASAASSPLGHLLLQDRDRRTEHRAAGAPRKLSTRIAGAGTLRPPPTRPVGGSLHEHRRRNAGREESHDT